MNCKFVNLSASIMGTFIAEFYSHFISSIFATSYWSFCMFVLLHFQMIKSKQIRIFESTKTLFANFGM